jgi:ABC-type nitrate/sulfonate/bicarbonate transport system substrate-binding protein
MADRLLVNVFNEDAALIVARAKGLFTNNGLEVEVMATPN